MSRAAEELHLTQPAISMQIKQLEEHVGVALFELNGRRLYLTEAGQELRLHAQWFANQAVELQYAMDQYRGLERGLLRIAVVSTANYFLPPLLAGFSEKHPGVRTSLHVANRQSVLASLADHRVDIAITGEPPDEQDLDSQRFMENPLVIIANPTHPLATWERVPLTRLREERLVVRETGSGTRAAMERHFAEQKINCRWGCEFNSNEAIKQAVQSGLGLGVVSRHTIELELETRRVVVLPVEGFPIIRHWYCVHRRDKHLSAASRAFRDVLLSQESVASPDQKPPRPGRLPRHAARSTRAGRRK
jgi:DNA-binding transcriptional LysR family regulator